MAGAETRPRFSFFGGKGGVGKTTCAASAAVRAASEGARVLVVSTDPAHSLADALAVRLGPEARRVRNGRGELYASELDADRALRRWLGERDDAFRTIAERGTYLDDDDIDRLLSLSFPGVDELVGLVELYRLAHARSDHYDEVVVDTAPTGHTLRLLEMPDTLARLGQVLDDMHAKHRFLASRLGGAWRPDFADAVIDDVAREASELRELVTDPARASFTWVTLPEELSVRESKDAVVALAKLGVDVPVIVVNRVWPAPDRVCPVCGPRVRAERFWRLEVVRHFPGKRIVEVPAQRLEPRGPAALLDLARSVRGLRKRASTAAGAERRDPPSTPRAKDVGPTVRLLFSSSTQLVLFGGKGGVGKTTTTAASALELAERRPNDRILVLSTDPAHSLGDALGLPLSDDERPVPLRQRDRSLGPRGSTNLFARELDAARAWESERERYRRSIDDLFSSIFRGTMDASFDRAILEDLLDLAPPGIDELLAVVTILDALAPPARYELVLVDTAPTGHTLRLLALPEKALAWVHALMATVLKYRSVVGLGEFATDLTLLARRLRGLIALLSDPARAGFVAVTRPASLPRLETERLARALEGLGVPLQAIVVNGVTAPGCSRCRSAVALERAEIARLGLLAKRFARSPELVVAPAIYPGPRGTRELRSWRRTWSGNDRRRR